MKCMRFWGWREEVGNISDWCFVELMVPRFPPLPPPPFHGSQYDWRNVKRPHAAQVLLNSIVIKLISFHAWQCHLTSFLVYGQRLLGLECLHTASKVEINDNTYLRSSPESGNPFDTGKRKYSVQWEPTQNLSSIAVVTSIISFPVSFSISHLPRNWRTMREESSPQHPLPQLHSPSTISPFHQTSLVRKIYSVSKWREVYPARGWNFMHLLVLTSCNLPSYSRNTGFLWSVISLMLNLNCMWRANSNNWASSCFLRDRPNGRVRRMYACMDVDSPSMYPTTPLAFVTSFLVTFKGRSFREGGKRDKDQAIFNRTTGKKRKTQSSETWLMHRCIYVTWIS